MNKYYMKFFDGKPDCVTRPTVSLDVEKLLNIFKPNFMRINIYTTVIFYKILEEIGSAILEIKFKENLNWREEEAGVQTAF